MLRRGAAVLIVAMLGTVAHAQPSDEVGIERFHVAIDRAGILDVEWAGVPPHLAWNAGVFVGFAHAPLVVYDRNMEPVDALVDRRLTTSLTGSIALFGRMQLGATLDVVGYQSGADVLSTMEALPSGGVGDVRLLGKLTVVGSDRSQLALIPALTIPGGEAGGYLREAGVTFSPAIAASVRFDALRIAANVGYHVKPRVDSAGLVSDDEAFLRIAAGYELGAPRAPRAELWLASSIATPLVDAERNQVALEVLAGAAYRFRAMVDGFIAGGIGLDNGFGTPDWRALAGVRFGAPIAERPLSGLTATTAPGVTPPTTTAPVPPADTTAHVQGSVVDPDGRPLPGAKVTIVELDRPDASPLELTADGEGLFAVDLEPGALEITARVREFKDNVTQVRAEAGGKTQVSVQLVRAVRQGQLRGQVLSFKGKPLAATIHVKGKTETTATTDADGQFTIELPEGTFSVEIASPGHVMQKRNVTIKLDTVTVLNVDLRSGK